MWSDSDLIAFIFYNKQRARFGGNDIGPADADIGAEELVPEILVAAGI